MLGSIVCPSLSLSFPPPSPGQLGWLDGEAAAGCKGPTGRAHKENRQIRAGKPRDSLGLQPPPPPPPLLHGSVGRALTAERLPVPREPPWLRLDAERPRRERRAEPSGHGRLLPPPPLLAVVGRAPKAGRRWGPRCLLVAVDEPGRSSGPPVGARQWRRLLLLGEEEKEEGRGGGGAAAAVAAAVRRWRPPTAGRGCPAAAPAGAAPPPPAPSCALLLWLLPLGMGGKQSTAAATATAGRSRGGALAGVASDDSAVPPPGGATHLGHYRGAGVGGAAAASMGLRSRSVSSVAGVGVGLGMEPSSAAAASSSSSAATGPGNVPFGLYTAASTTAAADSERTAGGSGSGADSTHPYPAHGNGYQETGGGHHRDGMLYLGSRASLADALPLHIGPRWFSSHSGECLPCAWGLVGCCHPHQQGTLLAPRPCRYRPAHLHRLRFCEFLPASYFSSFATVCLLASPSVPGH